jgi:hypothetical protein
MTSTALDGDLRVGTLVEVDVWAYFYDATEAEPWTELLYDSLGDPTFGYLRIFKLATAVDLYVDRIYEQYLRKNSSFHESVIIGLVQSARDWPRRERRIVELVSAILDTSGQQRFSNEARKAYRDYVRSPRNEFAHQRALHPSPRVVNMAYLSAFDVIWTLNQLDHVLRTGVATTPLFR